MLNMRVAQAIDARTVRALVSLYLSCAGAPRPQLSSLQAHILLMMVIIRCLSL